MSKKISPVSYLPKNIISILDIPPVGRRKITHKGLTIGKLAKIAGCSHPLMRNVLLGNQRVKTTKSQRALEVILTAWREARHAKKKQTDG